VFAVDASVPQERHATERRHVEDDGQRGVGRPLTPTAAPRSGHRAVDGWSRLIVGGYWGVGALGRLDCRRRGRP